MYVDGWMKLADEGGGEVAGRCFSREQAEAEAIKRACQAVEAKPDDTFAWQDLGSVDGGQVGGVYYTQADCCLEALSLDPENARVWCNLGFCGGGEVSGRSYTNVECYQQALALDLMYADAWDFLGVQGGGVVCGRNHTKIECYQQALQLDREHATGRCSNWVMQERANRAMGITTHMGRDGTNTEEI